MQYTNEQDEFHSTQPRTDQLRHNEEEEEDNDDDDDDNDDDDAPADDYADANNGRIILVENNKNSSSKSHRNHNHNHNHNIRVAERQPSQASQELQDQQQPQPPQQPQQPQQPQPPQQPQQPQPLQQPQQPQQPLQPSQLSHTHRDQSPNIQQLRQPQPPQHQPSQQQNHSLLQNQQLPARPSQFDLDPQQSHLRQHPQIQKETHVQQTGAETQQAPLEPNVSAQPQQWAVNQHHIQTARIQTTREGANTNTFTETQVQQQMDNQHRHQMQQHYQYQPYPTIDTPYQFNANQMLSPSLQINQNWNQLNANNNNNNDNNNNSYYYYGNSNNNNIINNSHNHSFNDVIKPQQFLQTSQYTYQDQVQTQSQAQIQAQCQAQIQPQPRSQPQLNAQLQAHVHAQNQVPPHTRPVSQPLITAVSHSSPLPQHKQPYTSQQYVNNSLPYASLPSHSDLSHHQTPYQTQSPQEERNRFQIQNITLDPSQSSNNGQTPMRQSLHSSTSKTCAQISANYLHLPQPPQLQMQHNGTVTALSSQDKNNEMSSSFASSTYPVHANSTASAPPQQEDHHIDKDNVSMLSSSNPVNPGSDLHPPSQSKRHTQTAQPRSYLASILRMVPLQYRSSLRSFFRKPNIVKTVSWFTYYQAVLVWCCTALPFLLAIYLNVTSSDSPNLDVKSSSFLIRQNTPPQSSSSTLSYSNSSSLHSNLNYTIFDSPLDPLYDAPPFTWMPLDLHDFLNLRNSIPAQRQETSVTIIAAGKDRSHFLQSTLMSWAMVKGVSEIILVDYASTKGWQEIVAFVDTSSRILRVKNDPAFRQAFKLDNITFQALEKAMNQIQKDVIHTHRDVKVPADATMNGQHDHNFQASNDEADSNPYDSEVPYDEASTQRLRNLNASSDDDQDTLLQQEQADYDGSPFSSSKFLGRILGAASPQNPHTPIVVVALTNETDWVLGRAYNLAAKFATGKYILKLDCDISIHPDFIERHPINDNEYYTVGWETFRGHNDRPLQGSFYTSKKNFDAIHGYDERIATYGGEDLDLYSRFKNELKLEQKNFNLSLIHHLSFHSASQDKVTYSVNSVWVQINTLAVSNLASWSQVYDRYSIQYKYEWSKNSGFIRAVQLNQPQKALNLLSDEKRLQILRLGAERHLHDNFQVPWDVISELEVNELGSLLRYLSSYKGRCLIVDLNGSLAERMSMFLWALSFSVNHQRPLLLIWGTDWGDLQSFRKGVQYDFKSIIDIPATNKRLIGKTKIFVLSKWRCSTPVAECVQWDKAYNFVDEYFLRGNPHQMSVPENIVKHAVVHFNGSIVNDLEINLELRLKAWNSIVFSQSIRYLVHQLAQYPKGVGVYVSQPPEKLDYFINVMDKYYGDDDSTVFVTGPSEASKKIIMSKFEIEPIGWTNPCTEGDSSEVCLHQELAELLHLVDCSNIFPKAPLGMLKTEDTMDTPGIHAVSDLRRVLFLQKLQSRSG